MKLEKVIKSDAKGKKWTAIFCLCKGATCCKDNDKKKVHFGSTGMDDYTIKKDKEQRDKYRKRHKKDLDTKDFKRAGYLSRYVLWGDSSDLDTAIKDYKKRFKLK